MMILRQTPLRFKHDIRYTAKIKSRFIPKIQFTFYVSENFLKVTSEFKFVNLSLHQGKFSVFFKNLNASIRIRQSLIKSIPTPFSHQLLILKSMNSMNYLYFQYFQALLIILYPVKYANQPFPSKLEHQNDSTNLMNE